MSVLLRSETTPALNVSYVDMPPGTEIQVYDFQNQRLLDMPGSVSGSGSVTAKTRGAGLYRSEVSFRLNKSVTGNVDAAQQASASLKVTVAP